MKNIALILASGTGSRCNLGIPKQFAKINNKTILEYTINAFETHELIDEIYLVTSKEFLEKVKELTKDYIKVQAVIQGGETRKDSSYNGISAIKDSEANILIHDGVRPLISKDIITNCIKELEEKSAICVAIDSTDTIYEINENNTIKAIPQRKFLKRAQTPQCFKLSLIKRAHELANNDPNCLVTDDCGLVQYYNLTDIYLTQGDENNIKITYKEDLDFVKKQLNLL
ncbi:TPA: 2-C-methyl-D-erythritol 4-phosphate cytidylyltransferase [Candidatus Gastranaerophilales bacterium HUM_9]|nr:MAG TPA: 2-C-methyl-D-erythritol 4-phosphate cytidylyltransferase [Candidatus Gastranaerophilales bacterium HUM_9]HBX35009.1 2-C-methyl-D-erythritol 4-phosphate cytidylyltransferase [Cyanobacteria bacterium UBA11440]